MLACNYNVSVCWYKNVCNEVYNAIFAVVEVATTTVSDDIFYITNGSAPQARIYGEEIKIN